MAKAENAPDGLQKVREIALALPRATEGEPSTYNGAISWRIGKAIMKVFATWYPKDRELEFNSNDEKLLEDARFTKAKYAGRHSEVRLKLDAWSDWDRLAKLLAESHRITFLDLKPGKAEESNAHHFLKKALEEAPDDERIAPPFHGGGPPPAVRVRDQIAIVLELAEVVADRLKQGEKKEFDRVTSLVRQHLDGKYVKELADVGTPGKTDSEALVVARRAAGGAALVNRGKQDLAPNTLNAGITRVMRLLAEKPSRGWTPRKVLEWLDRELVNRECEAAIGERTKEKPPKVDAVLWRHPGTDGKAGHFIAKLENGRHAVITKLKNRWTYTEGTRDDALATIPQELFDEATAAVLGSSAPPRAEEKPAAVPKTAKPRKPDPPPGEKSQRNKVVPAPAPAATAGTGGVMAIVSKAIFEKEAKNAKVGDTYETSVYRSANARLESLASGGSLFLVTVRPGEKLWLVAILDAPKKTADGWSAKNATPIADVTSLIPRLGIKAKKGALGMSLQTPRVLDAAMAALLREAR